MASDVLRSVNRILQYQQERESRKVQESLALMQFGIQKRQADIKQYSQQMEVIDKANKQFKINIADKFIQDSGLQSLMNVIPTGIKDVGEAEESLQDIAKVLSKKKRKKDGTAFNKENASAVASALWVYKNSQEPSSIINLANSLPTTTDENLKNAFVTLAGKSNVESLLKVSEQAKQSLQNDSNILKEQYEFGQGDTKIQSTFGMFAPQVVNQFKQQQSQDENLDISSLTDLVEKETEDPTTEVSGERIYNRGYEPLSNQEILEKAQDFLTVEETEQEKNRLTQLSNQQSKLEETLNKLIEERDDLLSDYEDYEEDRDLQLKRYKYFKRQGDVKKSNEAAKSVNRLESLLRQDFYRTDDPIVAEKRAYDRVSFMGERRASDFEGTKTLEITNIKRAIRELERQRNRLVN